MDETYIGGRHKQSMKFDKKTAVFGMVERTGRVLAYKVKSTGVRVLMPIVETKVDMNSNTYTDEYAGYKSLSRRGYTHTTVNHSRLKYVREIAHINTIEGFWSQLKRSLDGRDLPRRFAEVSTSLRERVCLPL